MNRTAVFIPVLAVVMLLGLAPSGSVAQDNQAPARQAEGRQLAGSARNQARVNYAEMGVPPAKLTDIDFVDKDDFSGMYYNVQDAIYPAGEGKAALVAEPKNQGDQYILLVFDWNTGAGNFQSYDTLRALKAANPNIDFGDPVDPYAVFRKPGRNWTHKTVTVGEDEEVVRHLRYRVSSAAEDHAILTLTLLDASMEGDESKDARELRVEFTPLPADTAEISDPPHREKIKIKAGEFDCYVVTVNGVTTWTSVKFPGLTVKAEGEGTTTELVEFNE